MTNQTSCQTNTPSKSPGLVILYQSVGPVHHTSLYCRVLTFKAAASFTRWLQSPPKVQRTLSEGLVWAPVPFITKVLTFTFIIHMGFPSKLLQFYFIFSFFLISHYYNHFLSYAPDPSLTLFHKHAPRFGDCLLPRFIPCMMSILSPTVV